MKDPSSGPEFGKAGAQGAIWGRATRQAGWLQSGGWGGGGDQGHRQDAEGEAGREQSPPGASGAELKF